MRFRGLGNVLVASAVAAGMAAAGTVATVAAQSASNPPDYVFAAGEIKVGNAGAECAQLGELLGTSFTYSYKWNTADDVEGAPDGTETAKFYDADGNLVHSNTITILNSVINSSPAPGEPAQTFDWSATNSIGAVMVKAGTGYNVYSYSPQAFSDAGLYAFEGKKVSHVTFCWNPDDIPTPSQWCSPGYWRQPHHLDSWTATGISPDEKYSAYFGMPPARNRQGVTNNAPVDPTLLEVLQFPQYYGGDAFNKVGDLLSTAHPDINFTGIRVEDSCPLS